MKKIIIFSIIGVFFLVVIVVSIFVNKGTKNTTSNTPLIPTPININTASPVINNPQSKQAYYDSLLRKYPISGSITTDNGLLVTYSLTHQTNDDDNVVHIDLSNVNFQVIPNNQSCFTKMQAVSSDPKNLKYWCDYDYNRGNFQSVLKYLFSSVFPQGSKPSDFVIVWSTRAFDQTQAKKWTSEVY